MRILIVSDAYPPEIRSASHLMQELAEDIRDRGHKVTVATCYPQYNLTDAALSDFYKEDTVEKGIRVIRIRTLPHHKVNFIIRGISQLMLPYIFRQKLKTCLTDSVDAVLVYSPPLSLWDVGRHLKRTHGARFILNIQDIFPQNAIDLGALRNPFLIRFFERMEKKAYDYADVVTVHSPSNGEYLLKRNRIDPSKLMTLHNWVDTGPYEEPKHNCIYRKKLGLEDKFIFFFGGVMGPSQGLDLLIDAASTIRAEKNIVILLVGDGSEKERLMKRVKQDDLKNVIFHPFISKEEYGDLLKEVDVGLVCLTSKNKTPVVPGKILSYMATGLSVLALLNKESDGHQIIRDANCGYSVVSDDKEKASQLMQKMYHEKDSLKGLGRNGHTYALQHFSKKVCVDKFEKLMRS